MPIYVNFNYPVAVLRQFWHCGIEMSESSNSWESWKLEAQWDIKIYLISLVPCQIHRKPPWALGWSVLQGNPSHHPPSHPLLPPSRLPSTGMKQVNTMWTRLFPESNSWFIKTRRRSNVYRHKCFFQKIPFVIHGLSFICPFRCSDEGLSWPRVKRGLLLLRTSSMSVPPRLQSHTPIYAKAVKYWPQKSISFSCRNVTSLSFELDRAMSGWFHVKGRGLWGVRFESFFLAQK